MKGIQRDLTINYFADGTATAYGDGLAVILHRSKAKSCPWAVTMLDEAGGKMSQHFLHTEQDACDTFERMARSLACRVRSSTAPFDAVLAVERAALAVHQ